MLLVTIGSLLASSPSPGNISKKVVVVGPPSKVMGTTKVPASQASPMRLLSTSNCKVLVMFGQLSRLSSMPSLSLSIAKALKDHTTSKLAIKELRKLFIKSAF